MSNYLADGRPITAPDFTRRACAPESSVVVEACAGSGKTWLLVSRIIRLLLTGAAPGEILAITFTRRAAQEMRARLLQDLKQLARADDAEISAFLQLRGMAEAEAVAALDTARDLYEQVTTARIALTIETFHGWFWRLLERAPIGAGVPYAPVLLESTDRLRRDAWLRFSAALLRERHAPQRAAWESLVDSIGDVAGRILLEQFLQRRAEWWSLSDGDPTAALQHTLAPLRSAVGADPCERAREPRIIASLQVLLDTWQAIAHPSRTLTDMIERMRGWLDEPSKDHARDFVDICNILQTGTGSPREVLLPQRLASKLSAAQAVRYQDAHAAASAHLQALQAERRTWHALQLNEAGLACGQLLLDVYQQSKRDQQALDFTDLEWQAHRLLGDPDHAAYMQSRLDARYRHILLDEFQDTNPLQWQILKHWLQGYGEYAGDPFDSRPTVFVVGDPKQSIYRFRRAEPRIFTAALDLLRRDFGASHLRTNVTRRNATAVIDVLNRTMPSCNPLYQAQQTRADAVGAFVLLPLAEAETEDKAAVQSTLRDVLTTPRIERDSEARYREGRALANELLHWIEHLQVPGSHGVRRARWADVLVLIRRRTHLAQYERALRDAGVPFVSDRSGGLLATLEADDLTALLHFLTAPFADLKLAHALRSPLFSCSDEDLMQLAAASGGHWWDRLRLLGPTVSGPLARARELLHRWMGLVGVLPVHDLLDRIYHEADVRRRYAALAPAALHAQVQANLDAFIELALTLDAGRFPSLPRFVDELTLLKQYAGEESPDEGIAALGDAVRMMTIHGAKGLEAEIVVLADAHVRRRTENDGVLIAWPPSEERPDHFSLVGRGAAAQDDVRAHWFADDEAQRIQEDANLLYVAATRARQVLIVTGTAPTSGTISDSWYTRLQAAADLALPPSPPRTPNVPAEVRRVRDFRPQPVPVGVRTESAVETEAQRLGRAWHLLLELGDAATPESIQRIAGLTPSQADAATQAAARVRQRLPQFFSATSLSELELVAADGALLRIDRLVEFDDALWILDYKWRVTDADRPAYEAQLRRYADVLRAIRSDRPIRLALVTADAELIEVKTAPPVQLTLSLG